ncbi:uncharacterized protein TrAFT101_009057 [Trichoderma asperellum]|uniref:Uncharacterized protein n=1 Tax=Trichoderma asperellum (strain ATCC 204424 / CBS 433.97 / NBRC 101777) TaxID=1042311 RepID=A0A2T3YSG0_TRIA4|nr:hypothetical protein M441DRAFT_74262 [Trichoderma asperellum CBS 433.97]PTB35513.1 hypothetical protein M441DRAFT_74262 [Trichoderma asperellum CBS 433.97]UKZ94177.1 hypothetical protein TrAFT101_009057 [Trichoderma asperellum]
MLSTHREQENRVLSHQGTSKQQQQPKTPGMRYLQRGNENALTGFTTKKTILGTTKLGENAKFIGKKPLLTPTGPRIRAPLGNKTTNAKAKNDEGHEIGGKGAAKGIEKSQTKNATIQKRRQKQRQRQAEPAPKRLLFPARDGHDPDQDEPEYAPPNPQPLPYQSDVFPNSNLSLKGLNKENLLKGYYEHFYNPVDDDGVSRMEKQLDKEVKTALEKAIERNECETEEFAWNSADISDESEVRW